MVNSTNLLGTTKSDPYSLPMDIIYCILALLPIKDVARLKSVSKAWYRLISSRCFLKQYHNSQLSYHREHIFVFVGKDDRLYYSNFDISNSFNPKQVNFNVYFFQSIVGSCNGLLLCVCYDDVDLDFRSHSLILLNPSTLEHKLISVIKPASFYEIRSFGFGYDSKTDDYKVVRIVLKKSEKGKRVYEVGVYSHKSDSWKILEDFTNGGFSSMSGVLINNHMLHWLLYTTFDRAIWSFDVCTEQWSEVPLPVSELWSSPTNINVLDGRLCLLTQNYLQSSLFVMDVFDAKVCWVKLFDYDDEPLRYSSLHFPQFCFNSSSEVLIVEKSSLFWYNPTQRIWREVENYTDLPYLGQFLPCTRSLIHLPGCH